MITATTRVDGAAGEFRVADTTVGDQMYPSIAMDADGAFVISWTSYGQDGDLPYESNIYAKQFFSNHDFRVTTTNSAATVSTSSISVPGVTYEPLVVTTDDPNNHVVAPGQRPGRRGDAGRDPHRRRVHRQRHAVERRASHSHCRPHGGR